MVGKIINIAYAVTVGVSPGGDPNGAKNFANYAAYIKFFFNWLVKVGFALCVLMFIYAGIKYILAQGNPAALNEAKDIFQNTLIGFVMLILIYFLLKILGVNY